MKPKTLTNIRADSATIELTDHTAEPASAYIAAIRPEVAKFAIEMETVLRENDHKSGWDELDIGDLFYHISCEYRELKAVYDEYHVGHLDSSGFVLGTGEERHIRYLKYIQRMREEALDIANFCMFLCHNYPKMEEV